MDYDPNDRQSWAFTFIGGTSEIETEASESIEQVFPLTETKIGDRVWIVGFSGEGGISRLLSLGLIPGAEVEVVSSMSGGSIVVKFQNNRLGLGAGMANRVMVTDNPVLKNKRKEYQMSADTSIHLQDLSVGMRGRVVGYEQFGSGYKRKLLSMGLTPGIEFKVIRHAPLGDPVEIEVRGFKLSLRKQEADALIVEEVSNA
ncbi:MAG: ferrous iron transport protein A [Hydrococcus sp. Prado102]|jgi:ferrous iron transport protein A|nr:ferrous iron transport protein A [Hydrococcus sp. Prado102]